MNSRLVATLIASTLMLLVGAGSAAASDADGEIPNGRQLDPAGKLTEVGTFPTGGAVTPDGRFYWAVDAGRGLNQVRIIDIASGEILQTMPIPGGYVGVAFAPDGLRAYVSGAPAEGSQPAEAKGLDGDVVHVYDVSVSAGTATELDPIVIPTAARDGAAAGDELPAASNAKAWPEGLAVSPDGKYLVVALGQADQVAIVTLASGTVGLADVGRYPYGVVIDPTRLRAYVSNERDGTISVISLPDGAPVATIPVGVTSGPVLAGYDHPEGLVADPKRNRLYVAVTDRDLVTVIDTDSLSVVKLIDVGRPEASTGAAPVNPGISADGDTLFVANAGEDAIVALALKSRPNQENPTGGRAYLVPRSLSQIRTFRKGRQTAKRKLRKAMTRPSKANGKRAKAARKRAKRVYRKKVARLRKQHLAGRGKIACGGPGRADDHRWTNKALSALATRERARAKARKIKSKKRRRASLKRAEVKFDHTVAAAKRRLPPLVGCPDGLVPGIEEYETIGRIPTASYPSDVEATPDGTRLVWLASKGYGTGPNPDDESIKELLKGRVGVLDTPTDEEIVALTERADDAIVPANFRTAPAGTPVVGPGGGPSSAIKHVFYIVKENRTYDQIFGSDPRGEGDPALQVFDDNGMAGPTGGVTPNAHALSRRFSLMDHTFANSEESTAGHKITSGGYTNDYTQRYTATNRGKKGNPDIFPIGNPPGGFIFDQAVRQNVGFRVYGEFGAGNQPFANEGRPTYPAVQASTDGSYPSQIQGTCRGAIPHPAGSPNSVRCTADSGTVGVTAGPPSGGSRVDAFKTQFESQLAAGTVPAFNYLVLFNDHTDGTTPGVRTPRANVADNDLALGQVVELVSHSTIWDKSAIFVIEDDSQDGADSVDAHRIPAFVISPWAKHGGEVIDNRYDQYSFLHTIELILGLEPLSINDALATPLYDAFISGGDLPDVDGTRYEAIQPEVDLTESNPESAPLAALSSALPFDEVDRVPQSVSDRIIWKSVFGADSEVPSPGPGASPIERARAVGAMSRYRAGRLAAVRSFLMAGSEEEDETRLKVTARLLSAATGLSLEEAMDHVEGEAEAEAEEEDEAENEKGEKGGEREDDAG